MSDNKGLLSNGLGRVSRNKRYIVWFFLLNLVFAVFGTVALREGAHAIVDHSFYPERLMHSFDIGVYAELLLRPEFGTLKSMDSPALYFACLFFVATALFLPGVFAGYASTYRLPREDFFRACGRNLWRFIRLMIVSGIIMGIIAGALFALNGAQVKHAEESTNELRPFEMQMLGLLVIFLVMTTLRIWFDLAEADIVLNDQRAVRKSIGAAFRHTFRGLGRLLASYVLTTAVAAIILVGGLWSWMKFVSPEGVLRPFVMGQFILLLLLIPRFWQRGVAVSYWQQHMMVPVVAVPPVIPPTVPAPVVQEPPAPAPPLTPAT
jgi:hypothetical protein